MEIARGSHARFEPGDLGRFTGSVWLNPGLAAPDATNVALVTFSPGARTHWHAHPGGQFLAVTSGRGLVASRGEPIIELAPGDVVHVPAGEWHWHGGGSESPMTHVAVNGGGAPEWGEPVTDEEYLGSDT